MSSITLSQITNGDALDAAPVNNNFTTVANAINGNLDTSNLKSGQAVDSTKFTTETWAPWTPAFTGFSGSVNITTARYIQYGKTVHIRITADGTSNSTAFTFTLPVAAKSSGRHIVCAVFNGGNWITTGVMNLTAGSTSASMSIDANATGFSATGGKGLDLNATYEAN